MIVNETNKYAVRMRTERMTWKQIQGLFANHYVRLEDVILDSKGKVESAVVTRVGEPDKQDMIDLDNGDSVELYVPSVGREKNVYASYPLNTEKNEDSIVIEVFLNDYDSITAIVTTDEGNGMEGAHIGNDVGEVLDHAFNNIFRWVESHNERIYNNIFIEVQNDEKLIGTQKDVDEILQKYRDYSLKPGC